MNPAVPPRLPRRQNGFRRGLSMIRRSVRTHLTYLRLIIHEWDVRRFLPSIAHERVHHCPTILSFHSVSGRCREKGGYWSHSTRAARLSVVLRKTIAHDVKRCQTSVCDEVREASLDAKFVMMLYSLSSH